MAEQHTPENEPAMGMIVRELEPANLESPFDRLDTFLTPNHLFYVRNHFKAPQLSKRDYALHIGGAVHQPVLVTWDELMSLPRETRVATLECAGNGRTFLTPQVEGAQWGLGAVGTAEWTGVPLRILLERVGVASDAVELVFSGADSGMPKEKPTPPAAIQYARSLPREKAFAPEVLVAFAMNGRDLPQDHGFPVRLIVPGFYGMASVKWLTGIQAVREEFRGYWQTSDYAYWDQMNGFPVRQALGQMHVKSQIAKPSIYSVVPAARPYLVTGAAWSGAGHVSAVEISSDGGTSWEPAELLDAGQPFTWRRWQAMWNVPDEPGRYRLLSRATDTTGAIQPQAHDARFGSYVINQVLGIDVFVERG